MKVRIRALSPRRARGYNPLIPLFHVLSLQAMPSISGEHYLGPCLIKCLTGSDSILHQNTQLYSFALLLIQF